MANSSPEFLKLWDFSNPAGTEAKFREQLPEAAKSGDRVYLLQLLTQIARTQGLQGKFDEAHRTLDSVAEELKASDSIEGIAIARTRYALERGRVFNSSGKPADAMPCFEEAMNVAREAKLSRLDVDAMHMLAIAAATSEARMDWGIKAANRAKELNEIGWLTAIYNNLGEEYRAIKRYDEALKCFQSLIESQKSLGREPNRYARVDEAKMLRLTGSPRESLAKMRELEKELSEEDGFVCEELAEAHLATNDAAAAKSYFVKAYAKLKDEKWLADCEPDRLERLKVLADG